jgi:hypothetical protein
MLAPVTKRRTEKPWKISKIEKRKWLRGLDLNQRPPGYEPDELPGCSTPRTHHSGCTGVGQTNRADIASDSCAIARFSPAGTDLIATKSTK